MKILATVFLSVSLSLSALSQLRSITVEGGSLINTPTKNEDRVSSDGRSTPEYDITTRYKKSAGYFGKGAVEFDLVTKGDWTLYMPMGIEIMQNVVERHTDGYVSGCLGCGEINEQQKMSTSLIGCFVGLGLEHSSRKWQSSLALNIHNSIVYKNELVVTQPNSPTIHSSNRFVFSQKFLSGQLTIVYKVDKRFSVGPTCEVYFCNLNALSGELKLINDGINDKVKINMKQGGDNIWICPGFKVRYNL